MQEEKLYKKIIPQIRLKDYYPGEVFSGIEKY